MYSFLFLLLLLLLSSFFFLRRWESTFFLFVSERKRGEFERNFVVEIKLSTLHTLVKKFLDYIRLERIVLLS